MNKIISFTALLVFALAANLNADIVTSYSTVSGANDNNQAGPMWGQGITVNIGADTPDALIPSTVFLKQLSFQTSSSASGGSPTAFLHIYDSFGVNGSGTPTTIGNLIGVSSNQVDMAAAGANAQVTWNFGFDALDKSTTYHYILATNTSAATLGDFSNLVGGGFELDTGNPYTGGQGYRGNGANTDWDFAFEMITAESVPEPSAISMFGICLVGMAVRRRKK